MEPIDPEMQAARDRLKAKFNVGGRNGGRAGGARVRKRPVFHKANASGDDKKLQTAIKRMGLSNLPGVDEVAILKDDGKALVFHHPKIQAALNANTFILTGSPEEKPADQISSTSIPNLSPEIWKKFAIEWQKMQENEKAGRASDSAAGAAGEAGVNADDEDNEDQIPELVKQEF